MPGRGGNRKRKYTTRDQEVKNAQAAAAAGQHQHQQHHHRDHHRDRDESVRPPGPPLAPGTQPARAIPPPGQERERRTSDIPRASGSGSRSHPAFPGATSAGVALSAPPGRPPSQEGPASHHPPPDEAILASQNSPDVGPYKAAYLIEKSKLRFVSHEQQGLLDELDRFQREESTAYFEKERVLDKVLKANFG